MWKWTCDVLLPQPDACQTDFDAVSMIRGELFFFKAGYVWRIRDGHLESGYPALASRHWRGIPDYIDAAFEDKSGNIWFFQGERRGRGAAVMWVFGFICRFKTSLNRREMWITSEFFRKMFFSFKTKSTFVFFLHVSSESQDNHQAPL